MTDISAAMVKEREAGTIEQLLMSPASTAEIIIAKHRNGPTGKVDLAFSGKFTRIDNLEGREPPEGI